MAFITRCCIALLSLALLTACQSETSRARFVLDQIVPSLRGTQVSLLIEQTLSFSPAAQEALYNSVPLVIQWDIELRESSSLTLLAEQRHMAELRYLPLSEHFQVEYLDTGRTETYPRLRHALRALDGQRLVMDSVPLAPGDYEVRARVRLDRASLPAPMQLPALVLLRWRHDSEWTQWPFSISA